MRTPSIATLQCWIPLCRPRGWKEYLSRCRRNDRAKRTRPPCWHPRLGRSCQIQPSLENEDLGFKPASRLEQIGDKSCKQAEDRKHRMQSCADSASLRESGRIEFSGTAASSQSDVMRPTDRAGCGPGSMSKARRARRSRLRCQASSVRSRRRALLRRLLPRWSALRQLVERNVGNDPAARGAGRVKNDLVGAAEHASIVSR